MRERDYIYTPGDILFSLQGKSNNNKDYNILGPIDSGNRMQIMQTIDDAIFTIQQSIIAENNKVVVIPVQIGEQWATLVLSLNQSDNQVQVSYAGPQNYSLRVVKELYNVLSTHLSIMQPPRDYTIEQVPLNQAHDSGPIAILNMDSLARTGSLPFINNEAIVRHRNFITEAAHEAWIEAYNASL